MNLMQEIRLKTFNYRLYLEYKVISILMYAGRIIHLLMQVSY